jgi:Chaperone of endosialidase
MKPLTPPITNLITPSTARRGLLLIPLLVVCFACLPSTQAVTPAPDGGYPGYNTAEGLNALAPAIPGVWNTAIGALALSSDVPGGMGNTAVGLNSLRHNTTGDFNSALGVNSLLFNTIGSENVAIGYFAQDFNGDGNHNTAVGFGASFVNTTGDDNTAVGWKALFNNTQNFQTAVGRHALFANTSGAENVAVGFRALAANTTNGFSVAVGFQALDAATGGQNTAVGDNALGSVTTGNLNTAIGDLAGFSHTGGDSGNVDIGAFVFGVAGETNTTRIKNIYTTVQPAVGVDPDFVTINSTGRLGRANLSSRRYKHDIKSMDKASEALFALKPVSFRYNKEYDATQTIAYGLIAEEVAEVHPDLVGRNPQGQPESVRYEQINAMLLNEFLKEHRKVQELEATVAQQQKGMEVLAASLKEQAAQIQKVSAQLEVKKPASKVVLNNP